MEVVESDCSSTPDKVWTVANGRLPNTSTSPIECKLSA